MGRSDTQRNSCLVDSESHSLSERPTPTGFSQMSGLPSAPSAQGRTGTARLQPVMLRLVDDFLVLAPSRAAAAAIVSRIMQGADPRHVHLLAEAKQGAS